MLLDSVSTVLQSVLTGLCLCSLCKTLKCPVCAAELPSNDALAQMLFFQMSLAYLARQGLESHLIITIIIILGCDLQGASITLQQL